MKIHIILASGDWPTSEIGSTHPCASRALPESWINESHILQIEAHPTNKNRVSRVFVNLVCRSNWSYTESYLIQEKYPKR